MKKALGIFAKSGLGAAAGVAVYVVTTSLLVWGSVYLFSLLMAMLTFGIVFGVISAVLYSFKQPSLISNLLVGVASTAAVAAYIMATYGTKGVAAHLAAGEILELLTVFVLAALAGIGGHLALRIGK